MSKFGLFIITFIGIALLTVIVYLVPQSPAQGSKSNTLDPNYLTLIKDRFCSVARLIANSDIVLDAISLEDNTILNPFLQKCKGLESDLLYINITNSKDILIGSLDSTQIGKPYRGPANLKPLTSEPLLIQESTSGNIKIINIAMPVISSARRIGGLFLGAKVNLSPAFTHSRPVQSAKSPLILVIGLIFAVVLSFIVMGGAGSMKRRVLDELVEKQEHLFAPKITQLKKEEENIHQEIEKLTEQKSTLEKEIAESQISLDNIKKEYESHMQQIAQHPVAQSIEKLKVAEADLVKKLETLKSNQAQITKEIDVLIAQREEIVKKLELDRQEEKALHDRLELIKKKILRLEG